MSYYSKYGERPKAEIKFHDLEHSGFMEDTGEVENLFYSGLTQGVGAEDQFIGKSIMMKSMTFRFSVDINALMSSASVQCRCISGLFYDDSDPTVLDILTESDVNSMYNEETSTKYDIFYDHSWYMETLTKRMLEDGCKRQVQG